MTDHDAVLPGPSTSGPSSTGSGFGRLLVAVYGIFALAACARAAYQLATRAGEAPLAYGLSALAGVIYVVATVALARGARRVAWVAVGTELLGVLGVGIASLIRPAAFPDASVWSGFGSGYGYVPLVLPVVGLVWLWHTRAVLPSAVGLSPFTVRPLPKDSA